MNNLCFDNLHDLTGQESGVVVYDNNGRDEIIICNWTACDGLPRVDPLGICVMGLGEALYLVGQRPIDDLGSLVDTKDVIYDRNNDAPGLNGTRAHLFHIATSEDGDIVATVYAPEGWH